MQNVLEFMHKYSGDFENLKAEISQPDKNQKQETFRVEDKFALVLSNKTYDPEKTTMKSLPAVEDDHRNIKQTVKMLQIPDENIFEIHDATFDQMEEIKERFTNKIQPRVRILKPDTGIYGIRNHTLQGFKWDRVKLRAMMEGASTDYVIVNTF